MGKAKALNYIINNLVPVLRENSISVELDLDNNAVYTNDIGCSGYFDHINGVIACAIGTKDTRDWFTTFLHEYSHFEQWKENCKAWTDSQPSDNNSSDEWLDEYIMGKDIGDIENRLRAIAYLEYDCEVRTSEKVEEFSDIISKEVYIQKSNAYIAFYHYVLKHRKWYSPEKAPYLNEKIWKNMPTEFLPFDKYFDDFAFDHLDWDDCV